MFVGHFAPALLAATYRRAPRLPVLFVAAQLVDCAFFMFTLVGIEHYAVLPGATAVEPFDLYSMPWTHSLLGCLGWASAMGIALRLAGASHRATWIAMAVVASHWPLDWLVHAPDLTIAGGGVRHGLGLWNHPLIAMPLELALLFVALTDYAGRTRPVRRDATAALVALWIGLAALQGIAWLAPRPTAYLDPAPSGYALAALIGYAIATALAWWVARTRVPA